MAKDGLHLSLCAQENQMKILVSLAQAFSKKDVETKVSNLALPIFEHLVKILKWEDQVNYQKHIRDVNKWLLTIGAYKSKTKLKKGSISKWLFHEIITDEHALTSYIILGMTDYHSLPEKLDDHSLFQKLNAIYTAVDGDIIGNSFNGIEKYL